MTVLNIASEIAGRLQIPQPATLANNTDTDPLLIKGMMYETVHSIRHEYPWHELHREWPITLANGVSAYALPLDFNRLQSQTWWDRTKQSPIVGPLDPIDWQALQYGRASAPTDVHFTIRGFSQKQFHIYPTPGASEDGKIISFGYMSLTVFRPLTWAASTSWTGNTFCHYNGNIYSRGSVGAATTGTTPPTHTSGAVSDGSITWTIYEVAYDGIVNDTDECVLPAQLLIDGTIWRFLRNKNQRYEDHKALAERQLDLALGRAQGGQVLSMRSSLGGPPMIGPWSYPEQDYG